jgi:hypothetical protein
MNAGVLQPLSLGELLDRAFTLYRRHFWRLVGIMAIPSCLFIPIRFFVLRSNGNPFLRSKAPPQAHASMVSFGSLFLIWVIYSLAQGAVTYAAADLYLGRTSTVRGALSKIRRCFWKIIGLIFNVGIRVFGLMFLIILCGAIGGGLLAAILYGGSMGVGKFGAFLILGLVILGLGLGFWFSLRYMVSMPAMLLEDIKGRVAIRRSVELSRGRRGSLFVAVLLGVVVSYAAAIAFQGPFYLAIALTNIRGQLPTWLALAMSVSSTLGGAMAGPVLMIVIVLYYYDLRIRKEGFDLQLMMASLADPKPPDSISPA